MLVCERIFEARTHSSQRGGACTRISAQTCGWTTLVCWRAQRGVLVVGQRVVKLVCGRTHGRVLLAVRLARSVRVRRRVQRRRVQLVPRLRRRLKPPRRPSLCLPVRVYRRAPRRTGGHPLRRRRLPVLQSWRPLLLWLRVSRRTVGHPLRRRSLPVLQSRPTRTLHDGEFEFKKGCCKNNVYARGYALSLFGPCESCEYTVYVSSACVGRPPTAPRCISRRPDLVYLECKGARL
jgi:hypothetical protein